MSFTGKTKSPKIKQVIPTESQEQIAIFDWARIMQGQHKELELLYHIPNGGARHIATAKRLKAEGVKSGIPDICLPVAKGKYHGLYLELKRIKGGRVSQDQELILANLNNNGYKAIVCNGADIAIKAILNYLTKGE